MTSSFIIIALSLITFRIIKRSEFNEYRRMLEQIASTSVFSLIILKNGLVGLILIVLFVFSASGPLRAEYSPKQPSINLDDVESGQLLMRTGDELSSAILLSTDIKVSVAGSSSRTIISQRFINTGDTWAEGVYVFPIGQNAAVDTLKLRIGDRFIKGQIKEKQQAKVIYKEAKAEGDLIITDHDVLMGDINGSPFYIGGAQYEAWKHTRLIIDAIEGGGGMF